MMTRGRRLFASFAGVMLADILANSVALLIILIIITVAIKHEAEQERLEQVEDVGVLLSREIARSVVVNALPTSAPAMLHDYENSPIDRHKHPSVLPIIELHNGYLREYYSGAVFTRNELLFQNNRFDRYLRSLGPALLARLRVDIYSIDLFYIMMSILKSHNHSPRHWHFLGYQPGDKRVGRPLTRGQLQGADGDQPGEGGEGKDGENSAGGALGSSQERGEGAMGDDRRHGLPTHSEHGGPGESGRQAGVPWGMPEQIVYDQPIGSEAYPSDSIAYNAMVGLAGEGEGEGEGQGEGQGQGESEGEGEGESEEQAQSGSEGARPEDIDMPGGVGGQQNEQVRQSDEMFEALARMMGESMERREQQRQQGGGSQSGQPQSTRFRTASGRGMQQQDGEQSGGLVGEMPGFRAMLPALFALMKEAQAAADERGHSMLAKLDMAKQLLGRIGKVTETPAETALFDSIAEALEALPEREKKTLPLTAQTDDAQVKNVLAVPINRRVNTAALVRNSEQEPLSDVPGELPVSSHLNLYPAIYEGIRTPLRDNMMVLTPDPGDGPQGFRWRVVTTVSPRTDDFIVAFVYAAIDKAGRLLIATDENSVELDGLAVETDYPVVPLRGELWTVALYGLAAFFAALGVLKTYRRFAGRR